MLTPKEILNCITEKEGISYAELAKAMGIPRAQPLYDLRDGKVKRISENYAAKIQKAFPSYNMVWLLTGEGEMTNQASSIDNKELVKKGGNNYLLVPLIHIDSVGGMDSPNSITGEPQYMEGYVPFVNAQEGDRAIFQSGTSMIPTIPPGSIMQIRKVENWGEYFGYGNIFVIELKDGRRITKEIRKYSENPQEYVWCVSHNPEVEDEELPKSMITSVWKVIKILTDKGW